MLENELPFYKNNFFSDELIFLNKFYGINIIVNDK